MQLRSHISPTSHHIPSTFVWAALALQCPGTQRLLYETKPQPLSPPPCQGVKAQHRTLALPSTPVRADETAADAASRLLTELRAPTPAWALAPVAVASTLHGRSHHVHICFKRDADFEANSDDTSPTFLSANGHVWMPRPSPSELSLEDLILLSQLKTKDATGA